jgi:hypothetical protein
MINNRFNVVYHLLGSDKLFVLDLQKFERERGYIK